MSCLCDPHLSHKNASYFERRLQHAIFSSRHADGKCCRNLVFAGTLAALGQALIPYFTGKIIDFASIDPDRQQFLMTTVKLVLVSLACAVATGVRGGLFTVAMARLNIRIRTFLFASLLRQEQAFYDGSKTGEYSCLNLVTASVI